MAILELCGFNHWLLKMLDEYGCRQTVLIRATKRSSKKTDHRDANALGELLWANRKRLLDGQEGPECEANRAAISQRTKRIGS